MELAFEITSRSDEANANSGCARIYVFMSDGDPTDDLDGFIAMIQDRRKVVFRASHTHPMLCMKPTR